MVLALSASTWAASEQAMKLRSKNALSEYSPPETFLSGNFVADEIEPAYIFGKVKDFVKSRSCPTAWLIEEGEKKRIEARDSNPAPSNTPCTWKRTARERSTYYVFVDRSQANVAQWMQWRQQFHKSKAEPQYGAAKAGLEQAAQNGFPVDGRIALRGSQRRTVVEEARGHPDRRTQVSTDLRSQAGQGRCPVSQDAVSRRH